MTPDIRLVRDRGRSEQGVHAQDWRSLFLLRPASQVMRACQRAGCELWMLSGVGIDVVLDGFGGAGGVDAAVAAVNQDRGIAQEAIGERARALVAFGVVEEGPSDIEFLNAGDDEWFGIGPAGEMLLGESAGLRFGQHGRNCGRSMAGVSTAYHTSQRGLPPRLSAMTAPHAA